MAVRHSGTTFVIVVNSGAMLASTDGSFNYIRYNVCGDHVKLKIPVFELVLLIEAQCL